MQLSPHIYALYKCRIAVQTDSRAQCRQASDRRLDVLRKREVSDDALALSQSRADQQAVRHALARRREYRTAEL